MATPTKFVQLLTILTTLVLTLNPAALVVIAQPNLNDPSPGLSTPSQASPVQSNTLHLPFLNQVAPATPTTSDPSVIQQTIFLSAPTPSEVVLPYGPHRNDPDQSIPATITAIQATDDVEIAEPGYVRRPVEDYSNPAVDSLTITQSASGAASQQADSYNAPL